MIFVPSGYYRRMIKRKGLLVAVAVVLAGWLAIALKTTGGPNPTDYRTTVMQAAQGGLSAIRTVRLAGQADLAGRVLRPYLSTVLDDALRDLGDAQRRLADEPPPGPGAVELRDRLTPLLQSAGQAAGDLADAVDRSDVEAERGALDALGTVGEQLDDFVTGQSG
jgi:hypothetical protein